MLDLIQILDNACIAEQDTAVGVTAVDCHDRYALQQVRFGAISLLLRDDQITLCGLTCLLSRYHALYPSLIQQEALLC